MKKVLSLFLSLTLVLGLGTSAFAEGTTDNSRNEFLKVYYEKMNTIVELRAQTKAVVDTNHQIEASIKAKKPVGQPQDIKDALAKIKDLVAKNKALVAQAKDLDAQRKTLRIQYVEVAKTKNADPAKAKALSDQIIALTNQIETIRTQVKANNDAIIPLRDKIRDYSSNKKAENTTIKPLYEQLKALTATIKAEETAKNALWTQFSQNVKNKDYTSAAANLDSIIQAKTKIIADLKSRTDILNNIFNSLK